MRTITLDARVIRSISGHYEEALRLIEDRFHAKLAARGSEVSVTHDGNGAPERVGEVVALLEDLARLHDRGLQLSRADLKTAIRLKQREPDTKLIRHFVDGCLSGPSFGLRTAAKILEMLAWSISTLCLACTFGIAC